MNYCGEVIGWLLVAVLILVIGGIIVHSAGYKSGQLEAMKDKYHYQLVQEKDQETKWKRKTESITLKETGYNNENL